MNPQREYYAVRDLAGAGVGVTYWYRNARGILCHWPANVTRIGPFYTDDNMAKLRRLRQEHDMAAYQRLRQEASRAQHEWERTVAALLSTKDGRAEAMLLFSRLQIRCCLCGRQLVEERSKVLGIGPECGENMPHVLAERLVQLTGQSYEAALEAELAL